MGNTNTNLLFHVVFSTKNRERTIKDRFKEDLLRYIHGIIKREKGILLAIDGAEDHLHILMSLNPTHSLADVMKKVKANSSKWMNEQKNLLGKFFWQKGYGAFTVSKSQSDQVIQYIKKQEEHHKRFSFKEEYVKFLKLHEIEYKEKFLWD